MTPQEYLDWCRDMSERMKKYEYHFTNADRIRSMTDEELCDEYFRILNYQLYNYTDSRAGLLCWLKEEVKDDERGILH